MWKQLFADPRYEDPVQVRVWPREMFPLFAWAFVTLGLFAGGVVALSETRPVAAVQSFSYFTGALGGLIGAFWAFRLRLARVTRLTYISSTITYRLTTCAGILLLSTSLLIAVVGFGDMLDDSDAESYSQALTAFGALVGPALLIATASAGYSEYSNGMSTAKPEPRTPTG